MKQLEAAETATPSAVESAKEAGLRYVTDDRPGIRRKSHGKEFVFIDPKGKRITDEQELLRIRRLAIPPAWTNVWISPFPNGHLQATGRDARNRKQYRYHSDWRNVRDETKYSRMVAFGHALSKIRRTVTSDLKLSGLPRNKVLATVVRLLETTLIRVGNDEYAKNNSSYGLTTMLDSHARISGDTVKFRFKGKSGIRHEIGVQDRQLAKLVKKCQDLPGQEIFAYLNESGQVQDVTSQDVNAYLREITGQEFTAKDFRTWAGTVLAAVALQQFEEFATTKEARSNILRAVEAVAKMLGNTPAICRRCYVHPVVLDSYLAGATISTLNQQSKATLKHRLHSLKPEEAAVMMLLQQRLESSEEKSGRSAKSLVRKNQPKRAHKLPTAWREQRRSSTSGVQTSGRSPTKKAAASPR
jgi:DNA topoisomerase-1